MKNNKKVKLPTISTLKSTDTEINKAVAKYVAGLCLNESEDRYYLENYNWQPLIYYTNDANEVIELLNLDSDGWWVDKVDLILGKLKSIQLNVNYEYYEYYIFK